MQPKTSKKSAQRNAVGAHRQLLAGVICPLWLGWLTANIHGDGSPGGPKSRVFRPEIIKMKYARSGDCHFKIWQ